MTESGWLIEHGASPVSLPLYYAPNTISGWSENSLAACRFARAEDAEAIVNAYALDDEGPPVRIREHGWG